MLITIERLLDKQDVQLFRGQLDTAQWQDGRLSAGPIAKLQKNNLQLDDDSEIGRSIGGQILRVLGSNPLFISAALPSKIYPPRFNRYADGATYGAHIDSALLRVPGTQITVRSDLSATLFLSEPDEYEGGELEVEGAFGAQAVKLAAGDLVLYPASSLHRVTPVTRGARVGCFFWVESFVRDEGERALLFDMDQAIQGLRLTVAATNPHLVALTGTYHNLLRRWSTT
jgi:PKHD-type hydroxylase